MPVPFEQEHELFSTAGGPHATVTSPSTGGQPTNTRSKRLIMPVIHQEHGQQHGLQLVNPVRLEDVQEYLKGDLEVSGLNKIHKHLWFAGLPRCERPLHHQVMIDRKIMITERADLHLLWRDDRLYIKPLPDYLLSYDIWEGMLANDSVLSENAKGFLLSYIWLIRQKSDFLIAKKESLVSDELTWEDWIKYSTAISPNVVSNTLNGVNPRYLYGELRLGRVNLIYRLCRNTRSFKTFIRGYSYGYHTYASFVARNFAWVLIVIIYITIVLTAMQVGLATTQLQSSELFNRASYGFTVFSIVAPLVVLVALLMVLSLLIVSNLDYAVRKRAVTRRTFQTVLDNQVLQLHNH